MIRDAETITDFLEEIEQKVNTDLWTAQEQMHELIDDLPHLTLENTLYAKIWRLASLLAFASGDTINAKKYGFLSLEYAQKSGEELLCHAAHNAIGRSFYLEGLYSSALEYFHKSLSYYREHDIVESIATTLNNIGSCYMNLGLWSHSLESHLEALELRRKMGVKVHTAQSLTNIGLVYYHLEDYEKCIEYQDDAEKISIDIGNTALQAATIANKAIALLGLKHYESGLAELDRAIALNKEIGDKPRLAIALLNKGATLCDMALYNEAKEFVNAGLTLGKEIGDNHTVAAGLNVMGKIEVSEQSFEAAITYYKQGLLLSEELHLLREQSIAHKKLAEIYEKTEQWHEAYIHFQQYHTLETQRTKEASDTKFNHFRALHEVEKLRAISDIEHERNEELTELLVQRNETLALLEKQHTLLEELYRERNEIIGIASHDLKNPLVGLRSYSTMLLEDYDMLTDDDLKESLLTIQSTADKTLAIVTNLLDINKLESGKIPVNIQPVYIFGLIKMLSKQYSEMAILKGITLKTEQTGTPAEACVDEVLTVQVFDNLISNALKFSPPERTVTIRIIYPS